MNNKKSVKGIMLDCKDNVAVVTVDEDDRDFSETICRLSVDNS